MAKFRGDAEQSRERQVALLLLLESVGPANALTQDEIVRDLEIDAYPIEANALRKVKAYEGESDAVRQKFERDKARIRRQGFEIETVDLGEGRMGYYIDPRSGYAPRIEFTRDEERVVQLALAFSGFGSSGAFSAFNDGPALDGGLELSFYYAPILRALHLKRVVSFDYQSAVNKQRTVEPLVITVLNGAAYVVAKVRGSGEMKGYRFSRMTSMPVLSADSFVPSDDDLALAEQWRPEFQKTPATIDVVFRTTENYATLLRRQFPDGQFAQHRSGMFEVGLAFESPRVALRFVLDAADRIQLRSPKTLQGELARWLKSVNTGDVPDVSKVSFQTGPANDILGQTLQLMQAVRLAPEGLRISELARRFSIAPELVRYIMDRLSVLQPMVTTTGRVDYFPAHILKEADDWDDPDDDSLYRADFTGEEGSGPSPSELMWRDLFELNVALHEASRLYADPALQSAIAKIEAATRAHVRVENAQNESLLADLHQAIDGHQLVKIEYTPSVAAQAEVRGIVPTQLRSLNGHAYVRAFCTNRQDWRTFRVDRISAIVASEPATTGYPADTVPNWLTQVATEGAEVVVAMAAHVRWLFETLPGVAWGTAPDGRHVAKFRVSDDAFLDHLMLRAGADAVVARGSDRHLRAGHDLAKRIAASL